MKVLEAGVEVDAVSNVIDDIFQEFNYNTLKADVLAIATELGAEKFHLVGHDHGGVLGWTVAKEADRVLTYTSLSIPHIDAFSKALYGSEADQVRSG